MIKKSIFLIAIISLSNCSSPADENMAPKPNTLLNEADLIPIIIDLQILESHYHRNYQRPDAYKNALDSASYFVFEKYGVSRKEFKDSYTYYSYDVERMYYIYEATLDTLNVRISQPK